MDLSEELQNGSKADPKLKELYDFIDIQDEASMFEVLLLEVLENGSEEVKIEETEDSDIKLADLHHSVDIKGDTFECRVCNKKFTHQWQLEEHEKIHIAEQQLSCVIDCDKFSVVASSTYDLVFSCKLCYYKTYEIDSFEQHLKTHSTARLVSSPQNRVLVTRTFECKICDFKCSVEETFDNHLTTHSGKKLFVCKICDYRFSLKKGLEKHLRTHGGNKLFECKNCDFKTYRKEDWKTHLLTHPFKCNICDYRSTQKIQLKHHLEIHTGKRAVNCKICNFKGRLKQKWKKYFVIPARTI